MNNAGFMRPLSPIAWAGAAPRRSRKSWACVSRRLLTDAGSWPTSWRASPSTRNPTRWGRPRTEEKFPAVTAALQEILSDQVAGDPMGERTWVRNSVRKLAGRLRDKGFPLSSNTVWRFLKRMGFSMKTGVRKRRGPTRDPAARDVQFQYIAAQKEKYAAAGLPIISVDAKKKELIGNFRNNGRAWCKEAPEVSEHGFASEAECVATPYGVYDLTKNRGFVVVGLSHNTPEFAVTAIARWWEVEGRVTYPSADEVLILADGGGGNGSRCRAWKWKLQELFGDRFGLKATLCHYPPGCPNTTRSSTSCSARSASTGRANHFGRCS